MNSPPLTDRTRMILRTILDRPKDQFTAADVTRATGLPSGTVGPLLARMAGFGWLATLPGVGQTRPYRLTDEGIDCGREALRVPGRRPPAGDGRVWTLTELELAVATGEQPQVLLDAARAALKPRRS